MYVKIAFLLVTKMTSQMPGICSDMVSGIRIHLHTHFPDNWSALAVTNFSAEPAADSHHRGAQKRVAAFQNVQKKWLTWAVRLHMAPRMGNFFLD